MDKQITVTAAEIQIKPDSAFRCGLFFECEKKELIDNFSMEEIVEHFGKNKLLHFIGKEEAMFWLDLTEEP